MSTRHFEWTLFVGLLISNFQRSALEYVTSAVLEIQMRIMRFELAIIEVDVNIELC